MKKAKKDARQLKAWNKDKTKGMQEYARYRDFMGAYAGCYYGALWQFRRGYRDVNY